MQAFSVKIRQMSLLAGLIMLGSCNADEQREYRGSLFFGTGAYFGELDLRDGSVSLLANLGDTRLLEVAEFGDEQLLLSVVGPLNNKETHRLLQYKIANGGMATLLNGRHGRYLPVPEALFFDDGAYLKVRTFGGRDMEEAVVARHRLGSPARVLAVAPTRMIYSVDAGATVLAYDVTTQESTPLPALAKQCALDGALWVAAREALLCKSEPDYVFVSLAGEVQGRLELPDAGPFRALAYLHDQDAVVLSESWQTLIGDNTRHAVWIYDLASDRMMRLVKNQGLGSHVVYRAN